jgi:hypothetical protein
MQEGTLMPSGLSLQSKKWNTVRLLKSLSDTDSAEKEKEKESWKPPVKTLLSNM